MLKKWKIKRRRNFERICWLAFKRHEINLAIEQAVIDEVITPAQSDLLDLRFGLKDGKKKSIAQIARGIKTPPILSAKRDTEMSIWAATERIQNARFELLELDKAELERVALVGLGYEMSEVEIAELEISRSVDQMRQKSEVEKKVVEELFQPTPHVGSPDIRNLNRADRMMDKIDNSKEN